MIDTMRALVRYISKEERGRELIRNMKPCPPQPELVKMYFLYRAEGMQPNDSWACAMDFVDYPYEPLLWPHSWKSGEDWS